MAFENLDHCNRRSREPASGRTITAAPASNGTGPNAPALFGNTQNNPLNSSSCVNYYNVRLNPSNTGNIRGQSRFTLRDGLILTVDPSFQYVLANGGGSTVLDEFSRRAKGANPTGPGMDFNGDGDTLDSIRFYTPNNTNTHRIGLTSSLIWDINPDHRVRVAYTFDRAHHRQTGEWGFLDPAAIPKAPLAAATQRRC